MRTLIPSNTHRSSTDSCGGDGGGGNRRAMCPEARSVGLATAARRYLPTTYSTWVLSSGGGYLRPVLFPHRSEGNATGHTPTASSATPIPVNGALNPSPYYHHASK